MHNQAVVAEQHSAEVDEGIRIVSLAAVFTRVGIESGYAGGVGGVPGGWGRSQGQPRPVMAPPKKGCRWG